VVRALARWQGQLDGLDFQALLNGAQMAITIVPDQGERYQGIVPLIGSSLAQCLEFYFKQSEQIDTRIWLAEGNHRAAGLLLQVLPYSSEVKADPQTLAEDWQRITLLADTLTHEEHLSIDPERLLFRLFHEEQVRLFDETKVRFECRCSRERVADALVMLPRDDIEHLLAEKGEVSTRCEYCNQEYHFDAIDVQGLFSRDVSPSAPGTH
jgi:molecular chaperone Hsp33